MNEYLVEDRDHPAGMGGVQKLYRFANGYGASVIRTMFSYGGTEGQWELAVIKWEADTGEDHERYYLCYDTPITSDVVGRLEWDEVDQLLQQIKELNQGEASC